MSHDVLECILPEEQVKAFLEKLITTEETNAVDAIKSCLDEINTLSDNELKTFASELCDNQKELIKKLSMYISPN